LQWPAIFTHVAGLAILHRVVLATDSSMSKLKPPAPVLDRDGPSGKSIAECEYRVAHRIE